MIKKNRTLDIPSIVLSERERERGGERRTGERYKLNEPSTLF